MGNADALGDSPAAKARRKEIQAEIDAVFSRLANNSKKLEEIGGDILIISCKLSNGILRE
jgi:hypothetical protein